MYVYMYIYFFFRFFSHLLTNVRMLLDNTKIIAPSKTICEVCE